jgi:hypothetical protein
MWRSLNRSPSVKRFPHLLPRLLAKARRKPSWVGRCAATPMASPIRDTVSQARSRCRMTADQSPTKPDR